MLDELKDLVARYEGRASGREIAALGILHSLIAAMLEPRMDAMIRFIEVIPSVFQAPCKGDTLLAAKMSELIFVTRNPSFGPRVNAPVVFADPSRQLLSSLLELAGAVIHPDQSIDLVPDAPVVGADYPYRRNAVLYSFPDGNADKLSAVIRNIQSFVSFYGTGGGL